MNFAVFDYSSSEKTSKHLEKALNELKNLGAQNISYLPSGKPVAENCFVSISHSHGKCAVCVSEKPIGIDIEKIKDRAFEAIIKKTFGEKEKEHYNNEKSETTFYEIWTRKEAYSKISGDGIKNILKGTDTFLLEDYEFKTEIIDDFILTICEKK